MTGRGTAAAIPRPNFKVGTIPHGYIMLLEIIGKAK